MKSKISKYNTKTILHVSKYFILSVLSFFIPLACSNNDDSFTPQNIVPVLVGKGSLMGSEGINPQNIVINNSTDWNNLLILIDENRLQQLFTQTNIDFSTDQVICVFDNIYTNLGHEVTISNILENENNIIVTIQTSYTPTPIATLEQPFHIVKIPNINKPIIFQ